MSGRSYLSGELGERMIFISMMIVFLLALSSGASNLQQQYASIDCTVVDEQGKPISEAIVYAQGAPLGKRDIWGKSDKDGKLTLKNFPEGEYFVDAYKESERYPRHLARVYDTDKPVWRQVKLTPGKTEQITFRLGPKCARLQLNIEDPNGKPSGGQVSLVRLDGRQFGSFSAGHHMDGYAEYLLPPDAPFRVEVGIAADHVEKKLSWATWRSETLRVRSDDILKWKVKFGKTRSMLIEK